MRKTRSGPLRAPLVALVCLLVSCAGPRPSGGSTVAAPPPVEKPPSPGSMPSATSASPVASTTPGQATSSIAGADEGEKSDRADARACPRGMLRIQHDYCPKLERRCIKSEYDKSNRITICHEFAEGENECRAKREPLDVCIDRYEYPNEKGARSPVLVDFFDAERSCQSHGKRLCRESEWIAACEGPSEKPFPYGWKRSAQHCNIDNSWIEPNLGRVYSKHEQVKDRELARLDQSVPSGSKQGCVSEFGVYDLTGNFDEWVRLDHPKVGARSKMAGLKGGAWGHVRNACRPVTTSHAPEFTYYFISFRCCRDVSDNAIANEGS